MPGRVLVVDDEEGIRVLCRVNLELGGFEVDEAADGQAALDAARRRRPDVIFLDIMMPVLDGWDTLAALKDDDDLADIPVVLLTARTTEDDQIRGWSGGIIEFLAKPFNPQALVDTATQATRPVAPEQVAARRERTIEQLKLIRELRSQG